MSFPIRLVWLKASLECCGDDVAKQLLAAPQSSRNCSLFVLKVESDGPANKQDQLYLQFVLESKIIFTKRDWGYVSSE